MKPKNPFKVREYISPKGKSPFREWLDSLNVAAKARVQARILRIEGGNLGDHKSVGKGVLELRLDFGPGFRVYFAIHEGNILILLVGGDKNSQRRDIRQAQELWADFLDGGHNDTKK